MSDLDSYLKWIPTHWDIDFAPKQYENLRDKAVAELAALREQNRRLVDHLKNLQYWEATYRLVHDFKGDGSIEAGYNWDHMRKSGDAARALLAEVENERR